VDAFSQGRMEKLSKAPPHPKFEQINVQTCLKHWYKQSPKLEHLYDLLCDLVHPNFGSGLLTMRSLDGEIVAGGVAGQFTCMWIVAPTLACIVGAYNDIQLSMKGLCDLRLDPSHQGTAVWHVKAPPTS